MTESPAEASFLKYLSDERFKRIDEKIASLKELILQRADAGDKALDVAKTGLNEMRGMASDQARLLLPRAEYEGKHEALVTALAALNTEVISRRGADKGSDRIWYVVFAALSLLVGIGAVVASAIRSH
jgi:hypothetical protein